MNFTQSDVAAIEAEGRALNARFADQKPSWVEGAISDHDARFLAGLVHRINPERTVEIGVASGWSSAVLLNALEGAGQRPQQGGKRHIHGVDLSPDLYTNRSIATGAAVKEIVPELAPHYQLHTDCYSFQAMPAIGPVDFAFIDAHHSHPWATLDLIAVLPFLSAGAWVAMHDLNLCTFARHQHRNRAPYYLFYLWKGQRLHSLQEPTMIGAIHLEREPKSYLDELLEILCTPWELHLSPRFIDQWQSFVAVHFGKAEAARFAEACATGNAKPGG